MKDIPQRPHTSYRTAQNIFDKSWRQYHNANYALLEFQALSGRNSRPVALKVSFAHPGWSNQKETGRLITLRFGTIWGLLGPFGAIWDHMGPFGVIWDKNDQNDPF